MFDLKLNQNKNFLPIVSINSSTQKRKDKKNANNRR